MRTKFAAAFAVLALTSLSPAVGRAVTVYPEQFIQADFNIGSPPTGFTQLLAEIGLGDGPHEFDYTLSDENNVVLYATHVNTADVPSIQFAMANPLTTAKVRVVLNNITVPQEFGAISLHFYNYLSGTTTYDLDNSMDWVQRAPDTGAEGGGYQIQAVPEPSAWLLSLVGFGGLGAALRRRRAMFALAA